LATADLTVLALGRPDASASAYIAEMQRRLAAQSRVRYELDERRDRPDQTLDDKVASVEALLEGGPKGVKSFSAVWQ
jgi:uncharacterized protein YqgV (UPF0045/DUF77 family)